MVGFLGALAGFGFIAMTATLAYQCYLYLKYGQWLGLSVTYACAAYLEWEWCNFPSDWLGIHQLLSLFNVGVFAFLLPVALLWATAMLDGGGK